MRKKRNKMVAKWKYFCKGALIKKKKGLPWWLRGKESACSAGEAGPILGSSRSPEENGNPFQYSCLWKPIEGPRGPQSMRLQELDTDWVTKQQKRKQNKTHLRLRNKLQSKWEAGLRWSGKMTMMCTEWWEEHPQVSSVISFANQVKCVSKLPNISSKLPKWYPNHLLRNHKISRRQRLQSHGLRMLWSFRPPSCLLLWRLTKDWGFLQDANYWNNK